MSTLRLLHCLAAPFPPPLAAAQGTGRPLSRGAAGLKGVVSEVSSFALAMLLEISGSCGVHGEEKKICKPPSYLSRPLAFPIKEKGRHYGWDGRWMPGREVETETGGGGQDRWGSGLEVERGAIQNLSCSPAPPRSRCNGTPVWATTRFRDVRDCLPAIWGVWSAPRGPECGKVEVMSRGLKRHFSHTSLPSHVFFLHFSSVTCLCLVQLRLQSLPSVHFFVVTPQACPSQS